MFEIIPLLIRAHLFKKFHGKASISDVVVALNDFIYAHLHDFWNDLCVIRLSFPSHLARAKVVDGSKSKLL